MQNKDILSINTLDELYNYKKKVNEDFDKREKFIKDCMKLNELSNDSFYAIKESFEYIAPKLFKTKEGQNGCSFSFRSYPKISTTRQLGMEIVENCRQAGRCCRDDGHEIIQHASRTRLQECALFA